MKITDKLIEEFAQEYCSRVMNQNKMITYEEVAYKFFLDQKTEDILDFVSRRSYTDEVNLTQAMIECADRAGLLEEWMNTFDEDGTLWRQITRKLRKDIREAKKNDAEQE